MLFDVWFYPTDVGELCLQSLRLVSLQKQFYYFPRAQEVEVGPESRDTDMYSSAQQV